MSHGIVRDLGLGWQPIEGVFPLRSNLSTKHARGRNMSRVPVTISLSAPAAEKLQKMATMSLRTRSQVLEVAIMNLPEFNYLHPDGATKHRPLPADVQEVPDPATRRYDDPASFAHLKLRCKDAIKAAKARQLEIRRWSNINDPEHVAHALRQWAICQYNIQVCQAHLVGFPPEYQEILDTIRQEAPRQAHHFAEDPPLPPYTVSEEALIYVMGDALYIPAPEDPVRAADVKLFEKWPRGVTPDRTMPYLDEEAGADSLKK